MLGASGVAEEDGDEEGGGLSLDGPNCKIFPPRRWRAGMARVDGCACAAVRLSRRFRVVEKRRDGMGGKGVQIHRRTVSSMVSPGCKILVCSTRIDRSLAIGCGI